MRDQQIQDLKNAIDYLKRSMQLYGGMMVGESNRLKGLDFYKWKNIINQVVTNADRISFGETYATVEHGYDMDDVMGRANTVTSLFTEK